MRSRAIRTDRSSPGARRRRSVRVSRSEAWSPGRRPSRMRRREKKRTAKLTSVRNGSGRVLERVQRTAFRAARLDPGALSAVPTERGSTEGPPIGLPCPRRLPRRRVRSRRPGDQALRAVDDRLLDGPGDQPSGCAPSRPSSRLAAEVADHGAQPRIEQRHRAHEQVRHVRVGHLRGGRAEPLAQDLGDLRSQRNSARPR